MKTDPKTNHLLPQAGGYRLWPVPNSWRVGVTEPAGAETGKQGFPAREFPHTERHLQCVWFDAALRPAR